MNSKTMCSMGTYLGFMLTFSLLNTLPLIAYPLMVVSWCVSATYLHMMPFRTWLKSRALVEATKLEFYYNSGMQLYGYLLSMEHLYANKLYPTVSPETGQLMMTLLEPITAFSTLIAVIFLFLLTYAFIGLTYMQLGRLGFYRRLMI